MCIHMHMHKKTLIQKKILLDMYKLNTVRTFLDIACSASQLVLAIALERQANFNTEHFRMTTGSDAGISWHEMYSAGWFVCCIRLT